MLKGCFRRVDALKGMPEKEAPYLEGHARERSSMPWKVYQRSCWLERCARGAVGLKDVPEELLPGKGQHRSWCLEEHTRRVVVLKDIGKQRILIYNTKTMIVLVDIVMWLVQHIRSQNPLFHFCSCFLRFIYYNRSWIRKCWT